ncbi:PPM-type phosphatase-like domain [Dillenia turbinata]|uniref:protein-serine/threonine phosphatase n=1 Tax=Dillenia turbinata TaxID=194707 RepID=A0AAN8W043_9MAGN
MGNSIGLCFAGDGGGISRHHHHGIAVILSHPLDEGLGHSFCYIRPDPNNKLSSKIHSELDHHTTPFWSISGASVSANTSTPLSTSQFDFHSNASLDKASAFESSDSFASLPLQPVPKFVSNSSPLPRNSYYSCGSGPIERGFLSGPIERGIYSGPIEKGSFEQLQRSFSHVGLEYKRKSTKGSFIRVLKSAFKKTTGFKGSHKSIVAPIHMNRNVNLNFSGGSGNLNTDNAYEDFDDESLSSSMKSQNLQWAQGKAGEDRVHVVISEEHGWVFVGIYDGFNGPDAPDFLLSNLYSSVHKELNGLLWNQKDKFQAKPSFCFDGLNENFDQNQLENQMPGNGSERYEVGILNLDGDLTGKRGKNSKHRIRGAKKWVENQVRWRCEWDRERLELDRTLKEQMSQSDSNGCDGVNHSDVLKALSGALKKTEDTYLEIADRMVKENPELSLMGSCVLVMLMKGEDVYLMNVGDSRAVLARKAEPDFRLGKARQDLERINEETSHDLEAFDSTEFDGLYNLTSQQLTMDHSTNVAEEIWRIRNEHPDDASAVINDRVKGSLKVTRAFGAGFLKQPKWNNALLEMFRIDYVGTAPYISCLPWLYHHRLGPKDRFLILSSDGLYQYFTNEEAVSEVEQFITSFPEGDPAQHLIEELLFRAAKKAGMDFHQLLEIPQGDRRRYHDDVSVIIISLEGRIWRSSVKIEFPKYANNRT